MPPASYSSFDGLNEALSALVTKSTPARVQCLDCSKDLGVVDEYLTELHAATAAAAGHADCPVRALRARVDALEATVATLVAAQAAVTQGGASAPCAVCADRDSSERRGEG